MKTVKEMLLEEKGELETIKGKVRTSLQNAPEGFLRVKRKRGGLEFYYKENDGRANANGRYMKKREFHIACQIAQRDYDKLVLKSLENRISAIDVFLHQYDETDLTNSYNKTGELRRKIIKPWKIPEQEYADAWQNVSYEGKEIGDEIAIIYTEKGERVRSKSEKIIADKLYAMGIPYRYEYPVRLKGYGPVYPDFCVLHVRTRREYYLEHLGMMDNPEYVEKAIAKINTYARNDILLGDQLLLTFETQRQPLDTKAMEKMFMEKFL